jgi:histone deacetylase 1/2
LVSRFIEIPRFSRLQAAKRILRFVKGISTYGLFYPSSQNLELVGYSDNDWSGSYEDRKSTIGCVLLG